MRKRIPKEELESFDVYLSTDALVNSLWIIEYLSGETDKYFSPTEIAKYAVEELGVKMSRQSVLAALARGERKKFCHRGKNGFKLMRKGQEELLTQMKKENKVILLESGKPFSAETELANIFSQLSGKEIKINDPYVNEKTLGVIYKHFRNAGISVKILTSKVNDETAFKDSLEKINFEGINTEVRKINKGIIHDRYFIDEKHFWLCGNSLNNLGRKESLIVMLNSKEIHLNMLQTFNSRWQSAVPM